MIAARNKMVLTCVVVSILVAMATAANEYLPPNKGYNYDRPSIPFPDNRPPSQPSPSRPQPSPRPPKPSYGPPPSSGQSSYEQNTNEQQEQHEHHESHEEHHHHEPGMPFDFAYNVNENGNEYSHNAISDGDVTQGEYRVALPDGRTQIVKYTADWKNGFNAEVSYEGEASYPDQGQAYGNGGASGQQQYGNGGGYQY